MKYRKLSPKDKYRQSLRKKNRSLRKMAKAFQKVEKLSDEAKEFAMFCREELQIGG